MRTAFLNFFCFSIYKMVNSEYSMDNHKSLKISIRSIVKNPKILKFVPKKMCELAVKKLPFVIRYVPDQYKKCVLNLF